MTTIPQRKIGDTSVGAIGHGLMMLTWTPHPVADEPAFASMKAALDAGATFWNTGQFYGQPDDPTANLKLLRRFFDKYPETVDKVTLSVKGAAHPEGIHHGPDSSIENLRRDLGIIREALGDKKSIDIYEPARVDPKLTIEESTKNLATLQKEGLFKMIGLSEIAASAVRKAHAVSPIAAVEIELSLLADQEAHEVVKACNELGITVIAYSPLGRGLLAGKYKSTDDLAEGDMRKMFPWFQPEALKSNLKILETLQSIADKKGNGCTPAQLALAWCLALSPNVIPIPGSTSTERAQANIAAANVVLTKEEQAQLDQLVKEAKAQGTRYPEQMMSLAWGTGKQ